MKQLILGFDSFVNSQSIVAILALCLLISFSLACRLGDYLPASNSSTTVNESGAKRTESSSKNGAPGLCQNAFYPIGSDIERSYRTTYAGNSLSPKEYVQTYTDVAADKFTEHNKFSEVQNALNYKCTAEGLQGLQYDNGNTISTINKAGGKLETIKAEGLTFPAETRWQPGEKWTGNYQARWESLADGKTTGSADVTVAGNSEIIGEETVTVPAGTFQCFKVRSTTAVRFADMKIGGMKVPLNQAMTINTDTYYAKNVGIVKSVMTGTMGGAITELLQTKVQ